ncbi:hypothetical protein E2562_009274 [Oryza meyeriana var. granulata]|uniref:Uncharacterized protein n=1 Tax=Oryza meyeriana var. granulata TaxID=110450 RepID=A0A6G1EC77_9ORYZ|nr:hypothetical protein E2562_009274 [Oryza meyeriana var. granulata]
MVTEHPELHASTPAAAPFARAAASFGPPGRSTLASPGLASERQGVNGFPLPRVHLPPSSLPTTTNSVIALPSPPCHPPAGIKAQGRLPRHPSPRPSHLEHPSSRSTRRRFRNSAAGVLAAPAPGPETNHTGSKKGPSRPWSYAAGTRRRRPPETGGADDAPYCTGFPKPYPTR